MAPPRETRKVSKLYTELPSQEDGVVVLMDTDFLNWKNQRPCWYPTSDETPRRRVWQRNGRVLAIVATLIVLGWVLAILHYRSSPHRSCQRPPIRKEWRTLSKGEQLEYIGAVSCLMRQPSILNSGTSHYDDFVYAHVQAGSYSHYAAAFLAWHRLFVHNYEHALRRKCAFKGELPYWDWTLDSDDLSSSPIWDPIFGFGGDGSPKGEVVLNGGRCVVDGPFANTTRAFAAKTGDHMHVSHEVVFQSHCLTRGFRNDSMIDTLQSLVSPIYVEETLSQPDYLAFFKAFETGAHNAIPQFVSGDFLSFTAPNDPVFWLHHVQVDRLWWLWQQRDPEKRIKMFFGPAEDFRLGGEDNASLKDKLPMAGLSDDGTVEEVVDTEDGILCYCY